MAIQLEETADFIAFMSSLSADETMQAAAQAGVEQLCSDLARCRS